MNIKKRDFTAEEQTKIRNMIKILNLSLVHNWFVAIDKESGQTYFVESENNALFLSPTDTETESFEIDPNPENLLNADYQHLIASINPQISINSASNNPQFSINSTSNKHLVLPERSEFLSPDNKYIIFGRKKIRPLKSGEIEEIELKSISAYFEELILRKLELKPSPRALNNTFNLYNEYLFILEKSKYKNSEIYALAEKLTEQIEEVKEKKKNVIEQKATAKAKQLFTTFLVFSFLLVVTFFTGYYFLDKYGMLEKTFYTEKIKETFKKNIPTETTPPPPKKSQTKKVPVKRKIYTMEEILLLIEEYHKTHELLTFWRQEKIIESFGNKKFSKWEAKKQVKKIATKNYKN